MKTRSSRFFGPLFALSIAVLPCIAAAAEFRTGESPTHPADQILVDDLYLLGGSVTSLGAVRGDLTVLGGNVLVNGQVTNDVTAGGGTVSVLSDIGDDVRVSGGTVALQGAIVGDVIAAGGHVSLSSPKVGGDVTIGAGVVSLDSHIIGDVRIAGGDVRINGPVGGNVDIQAESVTLGPKAVITGSLRYKSPKEAIFEPGSAVRGETIYTQSPDVREAAKAGLIAFVSIWFVAKVFMVFTGAVVIAYVLQRYSKELVQRTTGAWLRNLGLGVVFAIVMPVVSVLLLFTVIGLSFGILGLLVYIASMIFASMITPLIFGSVVHKFAFKAHEYEVNIKTVLIGTALYFVVGFIPVIGDIAILGAMLTALGAALTIKRDVIAKWR